MTESPIYKGAAQKALDFISLSRNPYFVWRYGVKPGDNDSSVTGWMMMPLKSAKLINEDQKELFRIWMTGPMKPITKYGGMPKPTGCV